jgi:hypothetical protein
MVDRVLYLPVPVFPLGADGGEVFIRILHTLSSFRVDGNAGIATPAGPTWSLSARIRLSHRYDTWSASPRTELSFIVPRLS